MVQCSRRTRHRRARREAAVNRLRRFSAVVIIPYFCVSVNEMGAEGTNFAENQLNILSKKEIRMAVENILREREKKEVRI